jgi:hypothetical protein
MTMGESKFLSLLKNIREQKFALKFDMHQRMQEVVPSNMNFTLIEQVRKLWAKHWKSLDNISGEAKAWADRVRNYVDIRKKYFVGVEPRDLAGGLLNFSNDFGNIRKKIIEPEWAFWSALAKGEHQDLKLASHFPRLLELDRGFVVLENFLLSQNFTANIAQGKRENCFNFSLVKLDIYHPNTPKHYSEFEESQISELGYIFREAKIVGPTGMPIRSFSSEEEMYLNPTKKGKPFPGYNQLLLDAFGSFLTGDFTQKLSDAVIISSLHLLFTDLKSAADVLSTFADKH